MKKHLSIFSIAIALTFSFLFIGNVKAFDNNIISKARNYALNYNNTNFNKDISNNVVLFNHTDNNYYLLLKKTISDQDKYLNDPWTIRYYNNHITLVSPSWYYFYLYKYDVTNDNFVKVTNKNWGYGYYDYSGTGLYLDSSNYDWEIVYADRDIKYKYSDKAITYRGNTYHKDDIVFRTSFTVNFHLNGGVLTDMSDILNPQIYVEDFSLNLPQEELNDFINNHTPALSNTDFIGWYYDANFTQPYNSSDTISSDINLYAKWETPKTFNFHLNGGYLYDPSDGWGSEEDFSISLYNSEIEQFFTNLDVKKYLMLFDGWYYDNNYKNIFHINDNFTEDTYNLYAKWRYEKVDDFLDNTNFNEYTFDENYQYAIINRGNNGDSVYLGLPFSSFSLEVYEYNESTYKVKDGSSVCLTPIYTKNGFAIYDLNTLYTNDQEVLILPRFLFDNLDPNDFQDPEDTHHFYLTDNAYVSYTNDLSEADIVDSNGEHITINLQDSYELSQQYQEIYSNPENIFAQVNIFLNKMSKITSAIKGVFEYLFSSFNSTIQAFIIFLIVVVLISAIMRFIRRS